jgi:hypothetical protein
LWRCIGGGERLHQTRFLDEIDNGTVPNYLKMLVAEAADLPTMAWTYLRSLAPFAARMKNFATQRF